MSVYLDLTREFNAGGVRAVLSSGQAVVLHRLAIASKDGDWLLREDQESLGRVLGVLERRGARYRYGAPLDLRWLAGGWSAHFQFRQEALRVRCDFVTRPPRLSERDLERIWREATGEVPFLGPRDLARVKMTDREKDWPAVGELARRLSDPREQLLLSRSARDLIDLARDHPSLLEELRPLRPLLGRVGEGRDVLEALLDAERRALMHANEERLARYEAAARAWAAAWPAVEREVAAFALGEAHRVLVRRALALLPFAPAEAQA
jgi:hypothetical protein